MNFNIKMYAGKVLLQSQKITAVVGSGPQLGRFDGYHYETTCGKRIVLMRRPSSAEVTGNFKAMRWASGGADPSGLKLSKEDSLYVEVGCNLASHWYPFYGGSRSTTPELTTTEAWIAASKGEQ